MIEPPGKVIDLQTSLLMELSSLCSIREWDRLTERLRAHPDVFRSGCPDPMSVYGLNQADVSSFCRALPPDVCLPAIAMIDCIFAERSGSDPDGNTADPVTCLTAHPGLSELYMVNCFITADALFRLAEGAQQLLWSGAPGLRKLFFDNGVFTRSHNLTSSKALAEWIRASPHLEKLGLSGCWPAQGDKVLPANSLSDALEAIAALPRLRSLTISGMTPSAFCSPRMAPVLRTLAANLPPQLSSIDLTDWNLSGQPTLTFPDSDWTDGLRAMVDCVVRVPGHLNLRIGQMTHATDFLQELWRGLAGRSAPFDLHLQGTRDIDDCFMPSPCFNDEYRLPLLRDLTLTRSPAMRSLWLPIGTEPGPQMSEILDALAQVIDCLPALSVITLETHPESVRNARIRQADRVSASRVQPDPLRDAWGRLTASMVRHPGLSFFYDNHFDYYDLDRVDDGKSDPDAWCRRALPGALALVKEQKLANFPSELNAALLGVHAGSSPADVALTGRLLSQLNRENRRVWLDHWHGRIPRNQFRTAL